MVYIFFAELISRNIPRQQHQQEKVYPTGWVIVRIGKEISFPPDIYH